MSMFHEGRWETRRGPAGRELIIPGDADPDAAGCKVNLATVQPGGPGGGHADCHRCALGGRDSFGGLLHHGVPWGAALERHIAAEPDHRLSRAVSACSRRGCMGMRWLLSLGHSAAVGSTCWPTWTMLGGAERSMRIWVRPVIVGWAEHSSAARRKSECW